MAYADYRLCDLCNGKTFYDANLNYQTPDAEHQNEYWLHGVGSWAVICVDCAKDNIIQVHARNPAATPAAPDLRALLVKAAKALGAFSIHAAGYESFDGQHDYEDNYEISIGAFAGTVGDLRHARADALEQQAKELEL